MNQTLLLQQKEFFNSNKTRPYEFRVAALKALKRILGDNEKLFLDALGADLKKSPLESYSSELGLIIKEIGFALQHLHVWMKSKRVTTPLFLKPGSSYVLPEPLGSVLILGPWNYPLQLVLAPLVGAIAAGNTVVLKPSEFAPHVAAVLAETFATCFGPEYIAVCNGNAGVAVDLVQQPFDHIFFTGSAAVGRKVMAAASTNLVPVTLELGGKSPCLIWHDVNLEVTCRRVLWGKFLNAGQTCVAPDYVLVHRRVVNDFIEQSKATLRQFYGAMPQKSGDYSRIVNPLHFDRLVQLLGHGEIVHGGEVDRPDLYIAPTLMHHVSLTSPLMTEEIFGPLLPIVPVEGAEEVLDFVRQRPKPLAFYLFTRDKDLERLILDQVSSGSVCINDTIGQIMGTSLPFGGVGHSGMGRYRGRASFECFSNYKSVLKRSVWPDFRLKYPPYSISVTTMKRFMKLFF